MSPVQRSIAAESAVLSHDDIRRADVFCERHNTAVLTIVFTDVVGSVALKNALGENAGVALIQRHFSEIRDVLRQFPKGEEIKTVGDGFLIIFSAPSKAAEFALAVQRRMYQIRPDLPKPLLVRIGIHMGEVVREDRIGGDIFGLQVDKAARIRDQAAGDEIAMSQAVYENACPMLARSDLPPLAWNNRGLQMIKGFEEPVSLYTVGFAALAGASSRDMQQPEAVIQRGIVPRRPVVRLAVALGFVLGMIAFSLVGWVIGRRGYVDPASAENLVIALAPFVCEDDKDEQGRQLAANLRENIRGRLESLGVGSMLSLVDLAATPASEKEAAQMAKTKGAHLALAGKVYVVRPAAAAQPAVRQLRLIVVEGRSLSLVLPDPLIRRTVAGVVGRPLRLDTDASDLTGLGRQVAAPVEIVLAASFCQKGDKATAVQLVEPLRDPRAAELRELLQPALDSAARNIPFESDDAW